jgi:dienelactone hydrolase
MACATCSIRGTRRDDDGGQVIIERTHYHARPGRAAEVLAIRREASAVRVAMGLKHGAIRAKADPDADGPDVAWECAFACLAERQADLDARAASAAFTAVRERMKAAIDRFERLVEEVASPEPEPWSWEADLPLAGVAIRPEPHLFRSDGRDLVGYLYRPPVAGPVPTVIYNHGSGLDRGSEDAVQPGVAALLMSWGYACFYPHRRGYGASPGPGWREECPDEAFSPAYNRQIISRLERESDDVVAALAHVRTLPGLDPDRVAAMGSSFGGVNTLFACAKAKGFRCGVEFAGAAMNWDRNSNLAAAMTKRALAAPQPIFYIQAENDFSLRPTREIAAALSAAGSVHEAKIYPPFGLTSWEGHLFAGRGQQIWAGDVRRFLRRWL